MFPIIYIFGKAIGSYAVCGIIGLFAVAFLAVRLAKTIQIVFEDIILMMLALAAGLLTGGHLLYAVTNVGKIVDAIDDGLQFSQIISVFSEVFGGMVFYGGLIGAVAALAIYMRCAKINCKKELTDIFAICVPLFHTFGRIGCFFGGCCYGIESMFGFVANNSLMPEMSGVRRFPVALLESLFNFILFLFLLYLFKKKRKSGRLLFIYMMIYPVGRFLIEFLRADAIRGIFFSLSTSQWISILLFAVGIICYIKREKKQITEAVSPCKD